MSVKFNIVERGNPSNLQAPKKFYPSVQSSGRVTTREVAEMAAQRSTLSTMDMMAAIESFLAIIPEQLAKGNVVFDRRLGEYDRSILERRRLVLGEMEVQVQSPSEVPILTCIFFDRMIDPYKSTNWSSGQEGTK